MVELVQDLVLEPVLASWCYANLFTIIIIIIIIDIISIMMM